MRTASARAPKTDPKSIGLKRLSAEQQRLLELVSVGDDNRAVFTGADREPRWPELKSVMTSLGGKWARGSKKRPGGFDFDADTDARELIRVALESGEVLDAREAQFFETPRKLAIDLAWFVNPQPGQRILEPSAGKGALVRAALSHCPGALVDCVEPFPDNRKELERQGFKLIGDDFMWMRPPGNASPHGIAVPHLFDGCLLNPPFSRRQDIIHITHALSFLKPGGKLAAIASAGVRYRDDRLAKDFRQLLAANSGTVTDNPAGSFAPATLVNTVMITMVKA
jgi:hypothetical protein